MKPLSKEAKALERLIVLSRSSLESPYGDNPPIHIKTRTSQYSWCESASKSRIISSNKKGSREAHLASLQHKAWIPGGRLGIEKYRNILPVLSKRKKEFKISHTSNSTRLNYDKVSFNLPIVSVITKKKKKHITTYKSPSFECLDLEYLTSHKGPYKNNQSI